MSSTVRDLPPQPDPAATYDFCGRKVPHRLHFMAFARGIPGYAAQFTKEVPPNFIAQVDDGVVDVACPCGATPRLTHLTVVACACDRLFTQVGGKVRVARAPAADAA